MTAFMTIMSYVGIGTLIAFVGVIALAVACEVHDRREGRRG